MFTLMSTFNPLIYILTNVAIVLQRNKYTCILCARIPEANEQLKLKCLGLLVLE